MHGCKRLWFLMLLLAGCGKTPATEIWPHTLPVAAILGEKYDPSATGTITGTVQWQGVTPDVPPLVVYGLPYDYGIAIPREQPNPNKPHIGERRGVSPPVLAPVQNAIVFIRNVDPKKSKPWDHPKVQIEQRDRRLLIRQGDTTSNIGWAPTGDEIVITSHDPHFHMLRGRGADFFSLPFADQKAPARRHLDKPGVVELSSGAFFFWMHGYLFVDNHPYYTRTDAEGRFTFDKVPFGSYELVCWMPHWEVSQKYRDPDTGYIVQIDFKPPVEKVQSLTVETGKSSEATYTWTLSDFK